MKTLYIECNMGAAGDMLMSALYELLEDKQGFLDVMNGLGLPGVKVEAQQGKTCGIAGTHMAVTVNGEEETEPVQEQGKVICMNTDRKRHMTMIISTNMEKRKITIMSTDISMNMEKRKIIIMSTTTTIITITTKPTTDIITPMGRGVADIIMPHRGILRI